MDSRSSSMEAKLQQHTSDEPSKLPYQLIKQITNDFDVKRILGSDGFGTVYKGVHESRGDIAVKVLHTISGLDDKLFHNEFNNLRGLKHQNIVELVGFCKESEEELADFDGKQVITTRIHMALCFEYVHMGSLNELISDENTGFNWPTRYRIIKGICEGLKYLREGLEYPIMHFDLKLDNILLDKDMVPKIAGFGLSKLFGEENTRKTMSFIGTCGYWPPEYIKYQIISKEHDIFSLGVVIVKIMIGHEGYSHVSEMGTWKSVTLVHKKWMNKLRQSRTPHLEAYCCQVKRCIEIAFDCLKSNRQERPTIQDIVSSLNETETMIGDQGLQIEKIEPSKLPYQLIKQITNDFDQKRILGSGGFGTVYKGVHENLGEIAVKILHNISGLDDEEFRKEFDNLKRLKHQNVVELVGFCSEVEEELVEFHGKQVTAMRIHLALCFEYVHNGSLDKYISDEHTGFDWHTRYKIIKGICEGLKYLHEELIMHCDLKPGNILLDKNKMPKIADFGLSKLLGEENTKKTMSSVGTRGYQPPEFVDRQIISREFDIYSLGVIIVKIMTGHEGYNSGLGTMTPKSVNLVHESWTKKLRGTSSNKLYGSQVKRCIEIAIDCLKTNRQERPTIGNIVSRLNEQYYQDDRESNDPSRITSITINSGPSSGHGEASMATRTENFPAVEPRVYMTPQHGSSLDRYISDISSGFDWHTRYGIIKGICEGLKCLHEGLKSPNLHLNLKISNILLDENMIPEIGDFGMPGLIGEENAMKTMSMMGTIEHMPPEFIEKQVISKEFDIYSLGIIIIKVITGERLYSELFDMSSMEFFELVCAKWRERLQEKVKGTSLEGYFQQVEKCLEIALSCIEANRSRRPTIGDIVCKLNETETSLIPLEQLNLDSKDSDLLIDDGDVHHPSELLLDVHPPELCFFPFMSLLEARKKGMVSCSLQLNNKGNDRVAFMLVANSPKRYLTKKPLCGTVPPRSAYTLTLTKPNKQQQPAPSSSSSDTDFFTLSSVAVHEYDLRDIDRGGLVAVEYDNYFKKAKQKAGNEVQQVTLKVLCCQQADDQGTSSFKPTPPTVEIITTPEVQQVSSIDVHQTKPWIMTTNHVGSLRVWNYHTMEMLNSFQLATYEPVHAAKFIAREKWVVAGDDNGGIHVYSYDQNKHVESFDAHNNSFITTLAVHPKDPFVLSSSDDDDYLIKLWDWNKSWKCIQTFQGHTDRVTQVMFNPENRDGFASASWDGTVKIWRICSDDPTNVITLELDGHAPESLLCVNYFTRRDRQHLIVGCKDRTAQICKLGMEGCVDRLEGHADSVTAVKLHPELPMLITGSLDGTIRVWNSTTYKLENIISFNLGAVYAFGCIKGSTRIVVGCHQGIATMEISLPFPVFNHSPLSSFHPGCSDNRNRKFHATMENIVNTLNETETFMPLLDVHPLELCFLPFIQKKAMISCSLRLENKGNDRVAFMLVANSPKRYLTKKPLCGIVPPRCAYNLTLTVMPNKQQPAPSSSLSSDSGGDFFTLYSVMLCGYDLMDVDKDHVAVEYGNFFETAGEEVQEVTLKVISCSDGIAPANEETSSSSEIITTPEAREVSSIDVHPTEPWIMTTNRVGSLRVWNYSTMAMMNSLQLVEYEPVHAAKFIVREKWLIAGDDNGVIHVYSYDQNQHVKSFDAHDSCITTLAVHPTDPFVLSSSSDDDDHLIKLWDWNKDWKCTRTLQGHTDRVTQVKFNPEDKDSFASASCDGTVKIWSICSDDASKIITLKMDWESLLCIDYFTRNKRQHLIVGNKDKTAQIWKLGMEGCVDMLEGHADYISAVNLHPEIPVLITGSHDGTVRIWNSTTYKLENIIGFNLGAVYALGCIKGSRRIVVGCHQGIATMELSSP